MSRTKWRTWSIVIAVALASIVIVPNLALMTWNVILFDAPPQTKVTETSYYTNRQGVLVAETHFPATLLSIPGTCLTNAPISAKAFVWTNEQWVVAPLFLKISIGPKGGATIAHVPETKWKQELRLSLQHEIKLGSFQSSFSSPTNLIFSGEFPGRSNALLLIPK
jgi:hypothetical protein